MSVQSRVRAHAFFLYGYRTLPSPTRRCPSTPQRCNAARPVLSHAAPHPATTRCHGSPSFSSAAVALLLRPAPMLGTRSAAALYFDAKAANCSVENPQAIKVPLERLASDTKRFVQHTHWSTSNASLWAFGSAATSASPAPLWPRGLFVVLRFWCSATAAPLRLSR